MKSGCSLSSSSAGQLRRPSRLAHATSDHGLIPFEYCCPFVAPRCTIELRRFFQRFIDRRLQFHFFAATPAAVGGDDQLALRVVLMPIDQRGAGKAPKTTECVAPIRAQASIEIASSGISGM